VFFSRWGFAVCVEQRSGIVRNIKEQRRGKKQRTLVEMKISN